MNLSKRQAQVHELALQGLTNREIAENLGIGVQTVGTDKERVLTLQGGQTLSRRERQIAELTASGFTALEMGGMLNRSPRTVEAHRWKLFKKLGVSSAVHLAALLNKEAVDALHARIAELEVQVSSLEAQLAQHMEVG